MDFYSLSCWTYYCIIFFFLYMYDYAVIDSGYCEASDSCGGFDSGDAWRLIVSLSKYS
jgi:hypothetical protein